jgi:D-alanine-D-alanine ligase
VRHVLHLVGSPTSAFYADLSRLYARDCLENTADPTRYRFTVAYVSPGGRWSFPTSLDDLDAAPSMPVGDAVAHLATLGIDVVVPQMFCVAGMTHYRALLDVLGLPYVGNTADVMALGAHKARARAVVAAAGVDVPHGELVHPGERPSIEPPAVVKPVDADNSVGVALVGDRADYDVAVKDACTHAGAALVETYVELGREVRCGIVVQDGELVCLPLEEYDMDPTRKPIRGYDDKLDRGGSGGDGDLRLLAKDGIRSWIVDADDPVTARVWAAARACHTALGCRDYSLFDFRIDPSGRPWFLEAGLYCSFARQSVIAVMAQAAGIGLDRLFDAALEQALAHDPAS